MAVDFTKWKKSAVGRKIDVDKAFGDQCVDVVMDFVQYIWHKPWPGIIGYGNAKDLYGTASNAYFQKIRNNRNDPHQLPRQGDVVVYGAVPGNPYGHIGVCDSASPKGVNLIQQDGFNPKGACFERLHGWTSCIGWLRPRTSFVAKIAQKVVPKPAPASYYVVHKGDTVDGISRLFHLDTRNNYQGFRRLNPKVKNVNRISIGQKVRVR